MVMLPLYESIPSKKITKMRNRNLLVMLVKQTLWLHFVKIWIMHIMTDNGHMCDVIYEIIGL